MNQLESNQYVVKPFILHTMHDGSLVVQSKNGIFRLYDNSIIKVVKTLSNKTGEKFSLGWIKDQRVNNPEKVLDFLIWNNILKGIEEYNFKIRNINFLSSNKVIEELVSYSFKDLKEFKVYNNQKDFLNRIGENETEFFFVFLNPLNKENSRDLRNVFMNSSNSLSIISYIYNNHLYIDSLYSPKWKLPCHLCNLELIESEHRIGLGDRITYQQVVDELFIEDCTFSIEMACEPRHELNIATQICNRIEKLITYRDYEKVNTDDFTKGVFLNLKSNKMSQGSTHHWELCDCYE